MAERELGAPPEPTITIGVPLRRWVPIALAAAYVLDSWKPVAVGNAAWVSTLSWISVSLVVTWYRVRRISVELTDSSLIISSPSHRPPLAITNRGGATAAELVDLAAELRAGVQTAFAVTLEPEPTLVGLTL